jgi:ribosomal protein S18 acetylase RimI-like enzyme
MQIIVEPISEVTPAVVAAFRELIPQLSESAAALKSDDLAEITSQSGATLLLARDPSGRLLGTVTVVCYRIPSGRRARIESLVVDRGARGHGVGRLLCQSALEVARRAGAESVDLTSSHSREEANALYQRMGFQLRESHAYRFTLPGTAWGALPNQTSQLAEHLGRRR